MCDTLFSPPFLNKNGHGIFAKNSDREANEAQQIVRYPRQNRNDRRVKTTFITVNCPETVFEVILSKPFQMWGAEMGANEHKVVIGNEAVFTKIKMDKSNKGLTGMDMLRLALEQATNALEAVNIIQNLLKKYGQDACGGYEDKGMFYHNSFIIADDTEGYVLETAGDFWVLKKVTGFTAISNILTIETDFDDIHPEAIGYAQKKGWIGRNEPFNFKKAFSAPMMTFLAKGKERRFHCVSQGENTEGGTFSVLDAFSILRSHRKGNDFEPQSGDMGNICLHATGLFTPSQTTGCMVVEIRKELPATVWLTGSAAPCLSVFKPFHFGNDVLDEANFPPPTDKFDASYWWQWELLHRKILEDYKKYAPVLKAEQAEMEDAITKTVDFIVNSGKFQAFPDLSQLAIKQSVRIKHELMEQMQNVENKNGFFYKQYWNKQNIKGNLYKNT
jgi:dipeptidase